MILLCYCVHSQKQLQNRCEWGIEEYNIMKSSKRSVITKKNNHNESTGKYYSYGNKGSFDLVDGSSVSQYTYRKYKDDVKNCLSATKDILMQQIASRELSVAVDDMC